MTLIKTLAIIVTIIAVVAAIIYLMGQFAQTRPIYEQIMGYLTQAKDYATRNWTLVAGSVGTVATVGGLAYSKLSQAKQQVTQATTANNTLQIEKDKLTAQIKGYEQQITDLKNQAPTVIDNADKIAALETQVKTAQSQLQGVTEQNTNFVKALLAAGNGALVYNGVDGKTYSVLKTPPEIQIK